MHQTIWKKSENSWNFICLFCCINWWLKTKFETPNFCVLIFGVVAIQKEIRPGSLFFFQIATTKKPNQKQIDTSHLVFNLLIISDTTKKTIVANMNLSKVEQENIRLKQPMKLLSIFSLDLSLHFKRLGWVSTSQ